MKPCKGCREVLPLSSFYVNPNVRDGHLNWCKRCFIERHKAGKNSRAAKLREYITAIKVERGCVDCGYRDHPEALDFDHLPGFTKLYRVATMSGGSTKAKIDAEIAKCEVVCANCHRIRTARRRIKQPGTEAPQTANG